MEDSKFYTVIAGRKEPLQVEYGTLNKTTGMPMPNSVKGSIEVGKILIPNYSRVWGKRVAEPTDAKAKVAEDAKIAVTDIHYKGKVEFLEWGADGGEVIEIRYLPHSNSLDKQYQDTVQKLRIDDERDIYIRLEQGTNDFDAKIEPLKVQFLKVCSYNKDSKSRDPFNQDYDFEDYSPSSRTAKVEKRILAYNEATSIVIAAKKDSDKLAVLANIFGESSRMQDDILYEKLLEKAQSEPDVFLETISNYKNGLSVILKDAVDAELVVIEDNSLKLFVGTAKPTALLTELEDGEHVYIDIINKALTPAVYGAYVKISTALNAYKKDRLK